MPHFHARTDAFSRLAALLVFLVGIAAIVFVFKTAYDLFQHPAPGIGLPVPSGGAPPPAAQIGMSLTLLVRQLVFLIVMIVAGSLIASRGIQMYFSIGLAPVDSAPTPPAAPKARAAAPTPPVAKPIATEPISE